jgi:hypothetical protein
MRTGVEARAVVLVEGHSDASAIETLAERRGRDLDAEGVIVVPIGGASKIGSFLERLGPPGLDLRLAGLYDVAEVGYFRRGLERVGLLPRFEQSRAALERSGTSRAEMENLGFFGCVVDLEDELIRALGTAEVVRIVAAEGELGAFRTLQQQPAHQQSSLHEQLHRFLGTRSGRKIRYGRLLVQALEENRVPRSLEHLLNHVDQPGRPGQPPQ